jgi:hypothetical protein
MCESYHMHQESLRKGSLIGKAVVLKTTAHCRLQVQVLSLPPIQRTCSSAESERDSAKVEVARSNRARSTNSKLYGVAELERRESLKLVYVGSNPTSVAMPA